MTPLILLNVAWVLIVVLDILVYVKPCSLSLHRWGAWKGFCATETDRHPVLIGWSRQRDILYQIRKCDRCGKSQRKEVTR